MLLVIALISKPNLSLWDSCAKPNHILDFRYNLGILDKISTEFLRYENKIKKIKTQKEAASPTSAKKGKGSPAKSTKKDPNEREPSRFRY